jgi:hypothetical protein
VCAYMLVCVFLCLCLYVCLCMCERVSVRESICLNLQAALATGMTSTIDAASGMALGWFSKVIGNRCNVHQTRLSRYFCSRILILTKSCAAIQVIAVSLPSTFSAGE